MMRKAIANILDERTIIGFYFDLFIQCLIIISVLLFSADLVVKDILQQYQDIYMYLEYFILISFTLEYMFRVINSNPKSKYIFSFYGIIDLLAILPFYIIYLTFNIVGFNIVSMNAVRFFRVLRVFKFFEHRNSRSSLIISNILLLLFLISISTTVFDRSQNEITFKSLDKEFLQSRKSQKKIALIIGNNDYKKLNPLKNAINDAKLIDSTLQYIDFKTIFKTNISSARDFHNILKYFVKESQEYDIRLIYYSGHAIQKDDENYLIPTSYESEGDCIDDDFDLYGIKRIVKEYSLLGGANILVLDACRNNPCRDRSIGGQGGLTKSKPPSGSFFAYSTGFGEKASDGRGDNSEYTKTLAKHLKIPNITLLDLFQNVRTDMSTNNINQMPIEENQLTGPHIVLNIHVEE